MACNKKYFKVLNKDINSIILTDEELIKKNVEKIYFLMDQELIDQL